MQLSIWASEFYPRGFSHPWKLTDRTQSYAYDICMFICLPDPSAHDCRSSFRASRVHMRPPTASHSDSRPPSSPLHPASADPIAHLTRRSPTFGMCNPNVAWRCPFASTHRVGNPGRTQSRFLDEDDVLDRCRHSQTTHAAHALTGC
jgi:hypothetical protein